MDAVEKHIASNQKRLEAIQRKKKESTKKNTSFCGKHTVFDISTDEEEESLVVNCSNDGRNKKIKLFDVEDTLKQEEDVFEIKEHFQGEAGEKLFRLQQKIGSDSRFKMDERFLDSMDEDMKVEIVEEKEERCDIQQEQEEALRIIDQILGTTSKARKQLKQATPSLLLRYDPDSNDCLSMEQTSPQKVTDEEITQTNGMSDTEDEEESTEHVREPTTVSEEKFYNVNSNLGNLFKVDIADERDFKFAFSEIEEEKSNKRRDEIEEDIKDGRPKWMKEGNESLSDTYEETQEQSPESSKKPGFLFFFHSDNPDLNRLSESSKFYRTETLQDIKEKWWTKRNTIKNSFRKNRREAMKKAQRTGITADTNI